MINKHSVDISTFDGQNYGCVIYSFDKYPDLLELAENDELRAEIHGCDLFLDSDMNEENLVDWIFNDIIHFQTLAKKSHEKFENLKGVASVQFQHFDVFAVDISYPVAFSFESGNVYMKEI